MPPATWNSIGTLASLGVTDPFYSGGNQSCTYAHDDLTRIASANCGSVFSQTFSYDAFGNLDTSLASPCDISNFRQASVVDASSYVLAPHSLVFLSSGK